MAIIISKFGGTSVSSRKTWENIARIIAQHVESGFQPVVICSALTQATNRLEQLIKAALVDEYHHLYETLQASYLALATDLEVPSDLLTVDFAQLNQWLMGIALLKEAPAKTQAQILSLGELMLTKLGHAFLRHQGLNITWMDAREALIIPASPENPEIQYLASRCPVKKDLTLAAQWFANDTDIIITQGFIASTPEKETVLLGRGGSDTSAALFAALFGAVSCEIWTDVPGIYTANPHQLPQARLLKQLDYDEAQEIASQGAKVLHPNCIPPVRQAGIPMDVKYTLFPEHSGTRITRESDESAPPIKSILVKNSITLISIDTLNMWHQVGFLADVFAVFKRHGFSIDLISTSEFNVTLSLDNDIRPRQRNALELLLAELNTFSRAKLIEPCSAVSLVGHHIRTILPQLTPSLEVFDSKQIYLMSLASNDLNLTFVVDESQAEKLSQKLHHLLIESNPQSFYYSKSWHEEFGNAPVRAPHWWETQQKELLHLATEKTPCYVYNLALVAEKAQQLKAMNAIDQLFYAVKANPNTGILKTLYEQGIHFDCVSIEEVEHILNHFPDIDKKRILFTPNFAPKVEYQRAFELGCLVTIDSLYPLEHWADLLDNQKIILRIDPGAGAGHHKYVCTGGNESKFGIPKMHLDEALALVKKLNVEVIGLHAHSGSGILSLDLWQETALMLAEEVRRFPNVRFINLGGGLGVVDKPGQQPLDLNALNQSLLTVKGQYPQLTFWLEPGRFFVAESGVILARVTQCKEKGKVRFIGIETGMNSLMRPMLYGAYHEIVNLTRLHEEKVNFAHIVGPICESGDTLGYDRLLPHTTENDILLIANTGAYGRCMSSSYNLRPPAEEVLL